MRCIRWPGIWAAMYTPSGSCCCWRAVVVGVRRPRRHRAVAASSGAGLRRQRRAACAYSKKAQCYLNIFSKKYYKVLGIQAFEWARLVLSEPQGAPAMDTFGSNAYFAVTRHITQSKRQTPPMPLAHLLHVEANGGSRRWRRRIVPLELHRLARLVLQAQVLHEWTEWMNQSGGLVNEIFRMKYWNQKWMEKYLIFTKRKKGQILKVRKWTKTTSEKRNFYLTQFLFFFGL